jgi:hypothetical protein
VITLLGWEQTPVCVESPDLDWPRFRKRAANACVGPLKKPSDWDQEVRTAKDARDLQDAREARAAAAQAQHTAGAGED